MADQDAKQQASDDKTVSRNGYDLTFYPGFASKCVIRPAGGEEVEMYRQTEPYRLPDGQTKPRDRYRIRLQGGERKQNLTFDVHDPERRVKRITVELYPSEHEPGTVSTEGDSDRLTLDNDTIYCPPICDRGGFDALRAKQQG